MKFLSTLLTCALLLASLTSHARILRVNSVAAFATTCADCFQTLSTAYNAAQDGDTLHLEPADANYGDLTIQKSLVIIGNGYMLGASPGNTGLQANSQSSMVNLITVDGPNAQGTQLIGLHFAGYGGGLVINNTSAIALVRCYFEGLNVRFNTGGNGVSNVLIAENYINGSITNSYGSQSITNLTIRNNIISIVLDLNAADDEIENLLVLNNTFLLDGNHGLKNAEVAYNVFYQGNILGSNNTVHDNISTVALTGGDASNNVVNMGNVYNLGVGTDDSKYDILNASPYNETGAQPRGAFSGISPYRLSGIPNIPTIYSLQSTLNTTPGGTVNVTLSTRSNP
jgi:hypothetical protein